MMTFKELKKLVKLPLYKEQRVPTVKALEESGVSVVAEKILENHGSISVYQNGYVIYAEKTESKIAELEEYLRNVRAAQKKEEDNEIVRAIRSTKLGGRDLLALLENIQAGNVTFQTSVNHENKTSEEAEMEDVIAKDA